EEGLELLLGRKAGVTSEADRFTRDSVLARAQQRLHKWDDRTPPRRRAPRRPAAAKAS
ncbi:MAG: hypothetical protein H0V89_02065, partial [Deltaproteobacteria bacterium]|nr:hypothetical protein [Deltaproteobacteria bacterium]